MIAKSIILLLRKIDRILNNVYVFIVIFLGILTFAFYLVLGKGAADSLAEQMLHREQLIVRSGARSIESFVLLFGKSMIILASRHDVISMNEGTQAVLQRFMDIWRETPIASVNITDKEGKVVFYANGDAGASIGTSLADREGFIWAKTAEKGKYYIGEPIIARLGEKKGKYIVVLTIPLIENGEFKGALRSAILLSDLASEFIEPLRISEDMHLYLIDSNGNIVVSSYPEYTGTNIFELIGDRAFLGSGVIEDIVRSALFEGQEKKLDAVWPNPLNDFKLERMLAAGSAINLKIPPEDGGGNQNRWYLSVVMPANKAIAFAGKFYLKMVLAIIFSFFAFLILGIRLAKTYGYRLVRFLKEKK